MTDTFIFPESPVEGDLEVVNDQELIFSANQNTWSRGTILPTEPNRLIEGSLTDTTENFDGHSPGSIARNNTNEPANRIQFRVDNSRQDIRDGWLPSPYMIRTFPGEPGDNANRVPEIESTTNLGDAIQLVDDTTTRFVPIPTPSEADQRGFRQHISEGAYSAGTPVYLQNTGTISTELQESGINSTNNIKLLDSTFGGLRFNEIGNRLNDAKNSFLLLNNDKYLVTVSAVASTVPVGTPITYVSTTFPYGFPDTTAGNVKINVTELDDNKDPVRTKSFTLSSRYAYLYTNQQTVRLQSTNDGEIGMLINVRNDNRYGAPGATNHTMYSLSFRVTDDLEVEIIKPRSIVQSYTLSRDLSADSLSMLETSTGIDTVREYLPMVSTQYEITSTTQSPNTIYGEVRTNVITAEMTPSEFLGGGVLPTLGPAPVNYNAARPTLAQVLIPKELRSGLNVTRTPDTTVTEDIIVKNSSDWIYRDARQQAMVVGTSTSRAANGITIEVLKTSFNSSPDFPYQARLNTPSFSQVASLVIPVAGNLTSTFRTLSIKAEEDGTIYVLFSIGIRAHAAKLHFNRATNTLTTILAGREIFSYTGSVRTTYDFDILGEHLLIPDGSAIRVVNKSNFNLVTSIDIPKLEFGDVRYPYVAVRTNGDDEFFVTAGGLFLGQQTNEYEGLYVFRYKINTTIDSTFQYYDQYERQVEGVYGILLDDVAQGSVARVGIIGFPMSFQRNILTAGSDYYISETGQLTTSGTGEILGYAVSSNVLITER